MNQSMNVYFVRNLPDHSRVVGVTVMAANLASLRHSRTSESQSPSGGASERIAGNPPHISLNQPPQSPSTIVDRRYRVVGRLPSGVVERSSRCPCRQPLAGAQNCNHKGHQRTSTRQKPLWMEAIGGLGCPCVSSALDLPCQAGLGSPFC